MRHVRHTLPALLAATALLVAACGDDDEDGAGQAQTSTSPAATAQGDAAITLTEAPAGLTPKAVGSPETAVAPKARGARATTYCSPTGDYCVGVTKRGGATILSIASLAFSGSYRLCVSGPPGRGCRTFRLVRRGQMYVSGVRFAAPSRGRYSASWFYGGSKLGRTLSFTA